jgi:hypothetical protein
MHTLPAPATPHRTTIIGQTYRFASLWLVQKKGEGILEQFWNNHAVSGSDEHKSSII